MENPAVNRRLNRRLDRRRIQPSRVLNEDTSGISWLTSEENWENRVGEGWIANRVLGKGGFGIVGHWKYIGRDKDSKELTDIVVKQASHRDGTLGTEEYFYNAFANALPRRPQHIIRMYRHMYTERGGGTMARFDEDVDVDRIFLEYCPGGDISDLIRRKRKNERWTWEELWGIFHCLAVGVLAMHQGTEVVGAQRWAYNEICHFDLKPENIFTGAPINDAEHKGSPIRKIADFGLAEFIPYFQDEIYLNRDRGTLSYMAPEQLRHADDLDDGWRRPWHAQGINQAAEIENPRYGTATNIWAIGLIMHCMFHFRNRIDWKEMLCYKPHTSMLLEAGGFTVGLLDDIHWDSAKRDEPGRPHWQSVNEIRTVMAECLLVSPPRRIGPAELVKKTKQGLLKAREDRRKMNAAGTAANIPMLTVKQYQEPSLSLRWYSGQGGVEKADQIRREKLADQLGLASLHPDPMVPEDARKQQAQEKMRRRKKQINKLTKEINCQMRELQGLPSPAGRPLAVYNELLKRRKILNYGIHRDEQERRILHHLVEEEKERLEVERLAHEEAKRVKEEKKKEEQWKSEEERKRKAEEYLAHLKEIAKKERLARAMAAQQCQKEQHAAEGHIMAQQFADDLANKQHADRQKIQQANHADMEPGAGRDNATQDIEMGDDQFTAATTPENSRMRNKAVKIKPVPTVPQTSTENNYGRIHVNRRAPSRQASSRKAPEIPAATRLAPARPLSAKQVSRLQTARNAAARKQEIDNQQAGINTRSALEQLQYETGRVVQEQAEVAKRIRSRRNREHKERAAKAEVQRQEERLGQLLAKQALPPNFQALPHVNMPEFLTIDFICTPRQRLLSRNKVRNYRIRVSPMANVNQMKNSLKLEGCNFLPRDIEMRSGNYLFHEPNIKIRDLVLNGVINNNGVILVYEM